MLKRFCPIWRWRDVPRSGSDQKVTVTAQHFVTSKEQHFIRRSMRSVAEVFIVSGWFQWLCLSWGLNFHLSRLHRGSLVMRGVEVLTCARFHSPFHQFYNCKNWIPHIEHLWFSLTRGNTGLCPQSPLQGDWRQSSLLGLATMLGCRFWIIDYVHTSWRHEKLNRRAFKTVPTLRFNTFHGWNPLKSCWGKL